MQLLEKYEIAIAEQLGMSGEDVDESEAFHNSKASGRKGGILGWLHRLRLQHTRAQGHLPVELEVLPSLPGVSRNHSNCIWY